MKKIKIKIINLFKFILIGFSPLLLAKAESLATVTVTSVIQNLGNWLFYIFTIAATIGIVTAAFFYLKAQGDPNEIKKAQNIIFYTIIAIILTVLAKGLTQFILDITGAGVSVP